MLNLSRISKSVITGGQEISILHSIDLDVQTGDYVSIMGPSGSGKSSLLNIIGLLDAPSSGQYVFNGEEVQKMSSRTLAAYRNQKIGFVFQAFMLIPRMTVKDNVEVPLLYSSLSKSEKRERIEKALVQVGMYQKAKEQVMNLSGGQKQKVAIARAIINQPDLILADEPTGNLDVRSKEDVMHIFEGLNKQGKTIMMVTHDQEIADRADRMLIMKNGSWQNDPVIIKKVQLS